MLRNAYSLQFTLKISKSWPDLLETRQRLWAMEVPRSIKKLLDEWQPMSSSCSNVCGLFWISLWCIFTNGCCLLYFLSDLSVSAIEKHENVWTQKLLLSIYICTHNCSVVMVINCPFSYLYSLKCGVLWFVKIWNRIPCCTSLFCP